MRRLRLSLGVLMALALAVLAAHELAAPRAAWAICYCASTTYQGPPSWGAGSSCTAATNNLRSNAWSGIECNGYNSCSETVVITTACYWDSGMYKVDGYLRYRCQTGDTCP